MRLSSTAPESLAIPSCPSLSAKSPASTARRSTPGGNAAAVPGSSHARVVRKLGASSRAARLFSTLRRRVYAQALSLKGWPPREGWRWLPADLILSRRIQNLPAAGGAYPRPGSPLPRRDQARLGKPEFADAALRQATARGQGSLRQSQDRASMRAQDAAPPHPAQGFARF